MPAKPIAISLCHLLLLSAAIFAQDGESSGEYSIEPDRHYFCGDARGGEEYIEVFLVHLNRLNQMEEPEIAREIVDELTRVLGNNGMAGNVSLYGGDYFSMAKKDGLAFWVGFWGNF